MLTTFTTSNTLFGVERVSDPKSVELFTSVQNQLLSLQRSQEPKRENPQPGNGMRIVSVEDALKELRDLGAI